MGTKKKMEKIWGKKKGGKNLGGKRRVKRICGAKNGKKNLEVKKGRNKFGG